MKKLKKYIEIVDSFDLWKTNEDNFLLGMVYNDLFWSYGRYSFWSKFKDNHSLNDKNKEDFLDLKDKKTKLFNKLDKSGRIFKMDNNVLMIFLDDFKSYVTLDFPNFDLYVIISSWGGFSVRLKDIYSDGNFKELIINSIDKNDIVNVGGHNSAIGGMLKDNSPKSQINFAKKILNNISELKKNF